MNKKYIYKVVIFIVFLLALTIGVDTCEGQERSFVYKTNLEDVLAQYKPDIFAEVYEKEMNVIPKIADTNKQILSAVAVNIVLDVAIIGMTWYIYRNQYWNN